MKIQTVTTYSLSMKNISGIEFNKIIASGVIKMRMGIIQNARHMIKHVIIPGNYGEINQVLTRSMNLRMEGENKLILRKTK